MFGIYPEPRVSCALYIVHVIRDNDYHDNVLVTYRPLDSLPERHSIQYRLASYAFCECGVVMILALYHVHD